MSNDNYPAGVTNAHPYFNPPREIASAVECGNDEALVVPFHAVKATMAALAGYTQNLARGMDPHTAALFGSIVEKLEESARGLQELAQEREYECPFSGEVDLEESECARWDCPVCGAERETDTLPEERDPDYEYDHRGEGR